MNPTRPTGMHAFVLVWLGQLVSLLGSAMTWFGFTIWAWEETGQATALALISFFAYLPAVLLSPLAGVLVDRWNRKWVMMISDLATALGTLLVLLLYVSGHLQIEILYVVGIVAGAFGAFQYPAYSAAVTTMLSKEQYTRAEGMMGLAYSVSGIFGPVLAAALLGRIGITGIMLIDLATFLAALGTLLWIQIPQPTVSAVGLQSRGSLWQETVFGFRYIRERSSLLALVLLFMGSNFFLALATTLVSPMILARSLNSETILATVQSVGALGGVVGGVLLSVWGGPRRRIHSILLGGAGACLLGVVWLGVGQTVLLWAVGNFFFAFFEPLVVGSNLAIWQSKVEADVQGRVLATRQLLVQIPYLLGMLVAGPLAESAAALTVGGRPALNSLVGTGPGAGMGLLLALSGGGGLLVFVAGYLFRPLRQAESRLPDQPAVP